MTAPPSPAYDEWLARVSATFEAVRYTCGVRLGDRVAGEAVALRVAAGLVARPGVFRYWGLPFSGRIAKLAEAGIACHHEGTLEAPGSWPALRDALAAVPPDLQQVLVWTCVEGWTDARVATELGCDEETAADHRARTVAHLRAVATTAVPRSVDPGGR